VLHWVNWLMQGNNCDYYYVGQGGEHKIPLSLSAVTIDTPGPKPSARDIAPRCLWSSSRTNPHLIADVNVVDVSTCKKLLKNPSDLRRPHGFWKYDQATQSAKGEENLAQSAKLLTSLPRRASDNHVVQRSTRSLGPWLGLLFEVRTAFGRGMVTVVRSATEENSHILRSAFCYLWTVNKS
jgi:hypothetical protein